MAHGIAWNTLRPETDSLLGCVNNSSAPPVKIVSSVFHRWIDTPRVCCILLNSMFYPASIPPRPAVMPIRLLSRMRKKKRPRGPATNRKVGRLPSLSESDVTCRRRPWGFHFSFEVPYASPSPLPPPSTGTPETATKGGVSGPRSTKGPSSGTHTSWPGRYPMRRTASIWEDRAGIDVRARPHRDGAILTITLFNRLAAGDSGPGRAQERIEKSLFEARVECVVEDGELVEYPRVDPSLLTEEEQELELQYKDRRIYAVGHGAAVDWDAGPHHPPRIWSEFMPTAETPMMTVDTGSAGEVLDLARLARAPLHDELEGFVEGYAGWIEKQRRQARGVRNLHEQAAAGGSATEWRWPWNACGVASNCSARTPSRPDRSSWRTARCWTRCGKRTKTAEKPRHGSSGGGRSSWLFC